MAYTRTQPGKDKVQVILIYNQSKGMYNKERLYIQWLSTNGDSTWSLSTILYENVQYEDDTGASELE